MRKTRPMTPVQIRRLRERLGKTQLELAQMLYVTRSAVAQWETGRSTPRAPMQFFLGMLAKKVARKKTSRAKAYA